MKVKTNGYKDWISENQLAKQGKSIADRTKAEMLWTNQFCVKSCLYTSPDNIRDMTENEKTDYKKQINEKRKIARKKNKEKEERRKELELFSQKMRAEWHTEWQWLRDYHRVPTNEAVFVTGEDLNKRIGKDWNIFADNYFYCNINCTKLLTDENELEAAFKESNEEFMKRHGWEVF